MKESIIKGVLVVLLIISYQGIAQQFEGKIVYNNSYVSKSKNVSNEQLTSLMGGTQVYYFKNGNYKSVFNGKFMQLLLYVNAENKLYNKFSTSNDYYWSDGNVEGEEVLNYELHKKKETILGYLCDELIIYTQKGTYTYYFNTDFKINAAQFLNHNYANWSFYTEKAKALPLKIIMDVSEFKSSSIAVDIERKKIENDIFILPKGVKILPITKLENK
ncbi:conserved hypothetical protein [Tenacibaculum sediminilitoris]|uniref:hypothetical protein n=1 Tax=Tenacibaculum sediminilitoris TaxID=1820334 RepID=UPI0038932137